MSGSDNHQAYKVLLVDENTTGVDASVLTELSKEEVKIVEEKVLEIIHFMYLFHRNQKNYVFAVHR